MTKNILLSIFIFGSVGLLYALMTENAKIKEQLHACSQENSSVREKLKELSIQLPIEEREGFLFFPELSLRDEGGRLFVKRDFLRSPLNVILLIGQQYCQSCFLAEAGIWNSFYVKNRKNGIQVVAINSSIARDEMAILKRTMNLQFPIVNDPEGSTRKKMKLSDSELVALFVLPSGLVMKSHVSQAKQQDKTVNFISSFQEGILPFLKRQ